MFVTKVLGLDGCFVPGSRREWGDVTTARSYSFFSGNQQDVRDAFTFRGIVRPFLHGCGTV